MRVIDRIFQFIEQRGITAYAFERTCGLSNGYLGKQQKGGGSIGSDVLEKIHQIYPELSLIWLISGKGEMLFGSGDGHEVTDGHEDYEQLVGRIHVLEDKVRLLENTVADKERIISLMQGSKKGK